MQRERERIHAICILPKYIATQKHVHFGMLACLLAGASYSLSLSLRSLTLIRLNITNYARNIIHGSSSSTPKAVVNVVLNVFCVYVLSAHHLKSAHTVWSVLSPVFAEVCVYAKLARASAPHVCSCVCADLWKLKRIKYPLPLRDAMLRSAA